MGDRLRPGDRAADRDRLRPLRHRGRADFPRLGRRPQLARHLVEPGHGPGLPAGAGDFAVVLRGSGLRDRARTARLRHGAAPAGGRAGERRRCGGRGGSGRIGAPNGIAAGRAPGPGDRPHGGRNRRLRSVPGRVGSRRPGGALATPLRAAGSQRGNAHDRREPGGPRQRQRVLQRLSRGRRRDAVGVPARARLRQPRHIHAGRPAVRVRRDRSRGQLRAGPGLHLRAGRGAHPAVDGEPGAAATAPGRAAPRRVPGRDGRSGAARPPWKGTRPADLHPVPLGRPDHEHPPERGGVATVRG